MKISQPRLYDSFGGSLRIYKMTWSQLLLLIFISNDIRSVTSATMTLQQNNSLVTPAVIRIKKDMTSNCVCRVMCLTKPTCTAVSVAENPATGTYDCYFSNVTSLKENDFSSNGLANSWIKSNNHPASWTTASPLSVVTSTTKRVSHVLDTSASTKVSTATTQITTSTPGTISATTTSTPSTTSTSTTTSTTSLTSITSTTSTSTTSTTPTTTFTTITTPAPTLSLTCVTNWIAATSSASGLIGCNDAAVLQAGQPMCLISLGPVSGSNAISLCSGDRSSLFDANAFTDFVSLALFLRATSAVEFKSDLWVGAQDAYWQGNLTRKIDTCEWAPGQPWLNSTYCGSISSSAEFLLATSDCNEKKRALCVKKVCSITFPIYKVGNMKVCYVPSWESGESQCEDNGGTFFTAADTTEFTAVSNQLKNYGQYFAMNTWVGVKEGVWMNGNTVDATQWASGVVNVNRAETCGALSKANNFLLQTYNCTDGMDVLCRIGSTSK